jgi:hypothetical protein
MQPFSEPTVAPSVIHEEMLIMMLVQFRFGNKIQTMNLNRHRVGVLATIIGSANSTFRSSRCTGRARAVDNFFLIGIWK